MIGIIGRAEMAIFCEGTYTRKHVVPQLCARHALEPTDHQLMYADDTMISAFSPHSVVAIRSA